MHSTKPDTILESKCVSCQLVTLPNFRPLTNRGLTKSLLARIQGVQTAIPEPFFLAANSPHRLYENHQWTVPGIIPRDGLVILASAPKTGKTCFATAIARAVAKGEPFLGQPVRQSPVLWCSHEETYVERVALHDGLSPNDPFYVAYPDDLPALDTPEPRTDRYGRHHYEDAHPPYIFEQAIELNAQLIVIDCLHAAVHRGNLAENQWARFVMGRLRRWSFHYHTSILVLHHLTKSATRGWHPERFADSTQILAAASCHFFMDRTQETETRSRITLHGRGRAPAPFSRLELISDGVLDYRIAEESKPKSIQPTVKERVLALLEEGWTLTASEIASRLQAGPATVRHLLTELKLEGAISMASKHRKAQRYCITTAPEND